MKDKKEETARGFAAQHPNQAQGPGAALRVGEPVPRAPVQMWALNGRLTQMQIRHLMNMKAFHGVKFR